MRTLQGSRAGWKASAAGCGPRRGMRPLRDCWRTHCGEHAPQPAAEPSPAPAVERRKPSPLEEVAVATRPAECTLTCDRSNRRPPTGPDRVRPRSAAFCSDQLDSSQPWPDPRTASGQAQTRPQCDADPVAEARSGGPIGRNRQVESEQHDDRLSGVLFRGGGGGGGGRGGGGGGGGAGGGVGGWAWIQLAAVPRTPGHTQGAGRKIRR